MNVLVINSGSSSIKFQIFDMENELRLGKGLIERIGIDGVLNYQPENGDKTEQKLDIPNHDTALGYLLDIISFPIDVVGHRIVQGGPDAGEPVIITPERLAGFDKFTHLAPLHNPACLLGVRAAQARLPGIPHVASFDTAYYTGMRDEDFIYPLPYSAYEKNGYRKFGFHSASHRFVNYKAADLLGIPREDLHSISCHVGGGVTVAASIGCVGVDTSVGYGTVCGVPMGTRSGDIDPEVILTMIEKDGMSAAEVKKMIYKESGLLGISGISSDIRDILSAAEEGNERADLALRIFTRSIRRYIGALAMSLKGRLDALIFTAGIGENSSLVRSMVCDGLEVLGVAIDNEKNTNCRDEAVISSDDSAVKILVVPTDEEMMMAIEAVDILKRMR